MAGASAGRVPGSGGGDGERAADRADGAGDAGDAAGGSSDSDNAGGAAGGGDSAARSSGARVHHRMLESLYRAAPINEVFPSRLEIPEPGVARIRFDIGPRVHHAAGAAHGTIYFKMLDDAAFYAASSLVTDRFLLTTGFSLNFTRPIAQGEALAEGRWLSGRKRVFLAEASLTDATGEIIGRGTGTFMRSRIALSGLAGYRLEEA